ncbi:exo-alpha-sialidase [Candidatus Woesearchaeota archaeon]|nr:exo-alpha-sialidase [Candidatus Woesearchaeota archaeon]
MLTSSGELVASYQYFSYEDEDLFGVIAYSLSDDNGETWTNPVAVTIEGLPEATTATPSGPDEVTVTRAVDPTLVELEDGSLRLYFTYQEVDASQPHPASAINTEGDITGTFVYEESGLATTAEDVALLDPSVVYFEGLWHYYTWNVAQSGIGAGSTELSTFQDLDNYHGTSEDGLTFTLEDPVTLDMGFLGQAVTLDDGIRFYGTGTGGIVSAFSSDGYTFEMDDGNRLSGGGGDPGVAQLEDGTFVMIYTGPDSVSQPS